MGQYHEGSKEELYILEEISKSRQKINNSSTYHLPKNDDYLIQTHEVISRLLF